MPSSAAATATMKANRRTDTQPEVRLRSLLHRSGLRFRKDFPVRASGVLVRPDIVFPGPRVAVFVDGCFWHACPEHASYPRANAEFWAEKFERNRRRDLKVTRALKGDGWEVLRLWEHIAPETACDEVAALVRPRLAVRNRP